MVVGGDSWLLAAKGCWWRWLVVCLFLFCDYGWLLVAVSCWRRQLLVDGYWWRRFFVSGGGRLLMAAAGRWWQRVAGFWWQLLVAKPAFGWLFYAPTARCWWWQENVGGIERLLVAMAGC